mgnify:CR=1 FL=1
MHTQRLQPRDTAEAAEILRRGGLLGIPGILIGTPATAVLYRLLRTSVRTRLRERQIDPADPRLVEPAPLEEPEKTE